MNPKENIGGVRFDPSISLGHIISILIVLGPVFAFFLDTRARLDVAYTRLDVIEARIERQEVQRQAENLRTEAALQRIEDKLERFIDRFHRHHFSALGRTDE